MSFVKIQIRCSQYKETTFSFDRLVSVCYMSFCIFFFNILYILYISYYRLLKMAMVTGSMEYSLVQIAEENTNREFANIHLMKLIKPFWIKNFWTKIKIQKILLGQMKAVRIIHIHMIVNEVQYYHSVFWDQFSLPKG